MTEQKIKKWLINAEELQEEIWACNIEEARDEVLNNISIIEAEEFLKGK